MIALTTAQIIAIVIFVVVMALIISEKVHRTTAALAGAVALILSGVLTFDNGVEHIDFGTLGVLVGMMIFVAVVKNSGIFEYLAIRAAKLAKGNPWIIMVLFCLITAVLSAFLDNVTTVLLIGPVTYTVCKMLEINPIPFFLTEIISSNVRGTATLIGVGSSICGGSAVAATASVIDADDEEVAQAISVIFFFNMLAAIFFPALGALLGFSTTNGEAFGIFAGTAINDTSSVTAAASTWDSLYGLGSQTLDKAVTVKLTRTLAIIPITLVLAFVRTKRAKTDGTKVNFKKIFPMFILYFLLASVITTICVSAGVSASVFTPLKTLSKFLIVMAMCAVGLNTNIVKLVKTGGKPLIMGFCCWVGIAGMSLLMQHVLGIW